MSRVVVVVPCYNEEHRLQVERFTEFSALARDVGLLFVDDGSTDRTGDILDALAERDERSFHVHRLAKNAGKSEAVRQGMLKALEARPDYVGYWDADLSAPLEEVLAFEDILAQRDHVDMVFGSRVKLLGRRIERSELRHYLGRIFATAVSLMLRLPIYDTQCGAKLFRVTPRLREVFEEPFLTEWFFDVEILARWLGRTEATADASHAIYEFPLTEWIHVEESKVGAGTYGRAGFDLMKIYFHYELYRRARALNPARSERETDAV